MFNLYSTYNLVFKKLFNKYAKSMLSSRSSVEHKYKRKLMHQPSQQSVEPIVCHLAYTENLKLSKFKIICYFFVTTESNKMRTSERLYKYIILVYHIHLTKDKLCTQRLVFYRHSVKTFGVSEVESQLARAFDVIVKYIKICCTYTLQLYVQYIIHTKMNTISTHIIIITQVINNIIISHKEFTQVDNTFDLHAWSYYMFSKFFIKHVL